MVQELPSSHDTADPPAHKPVKHFSFTVQMFPSSHGAPSLIGCIWHLPVCGLQVFFSHEVSLAVPQMTTDAGFTLQDHCVGFAEDVSQYSQPLQRSASSIGAQSGLPEHWQTLAPPTHWPLAQKSPWVHGLPSSQSATIFEWLHPTPGAQESPVQGLPSSQ
jgi:hypothetical protein